MLGVLPAACVVLFSLGATAYPVTQPVYQSVYQQPQQQYVSQLTYRPQVYVGPQSAPQYGVTEQPDQQPQQYVQQAQPVAQPLLGAVDRQIQKAATHIAGPGYAQQIAQIQLQGQAQQAQAQIQRNQLRVSTAPRAQPQLQYQRALQSQQGYQPRDEELQEDYNHNPSYQFGFDVKDDLYTNYQNRKEQRDGDKTTGSYSVVDSDGYLRTVTYTADPKEGFKAEVTRQPTDIVVKIPQPQPQYQNIQQQVRQPSQQQYVEVPAGHAQTIHDQGKQQRIIYQYQ